MININMRSSQFRKTANRNRKRIRNKKKTWRNKRTKNARGGGIVNGTNNNDGKKYEYKGEVNSMNQPHGNGVKNFTDSKGYPVEYNGEWQNGKKHGSGELTSKDKQNRDIIWEGVWENDKMDGVGKMKYYNDKEQLIIIEGIWKDDQLATGPYKKTIFGKNSVVWLGEILDDRTQKGEWFGETKMDEVDG